MYYYHNDSTLYKNMFIQPHPSLPFGTLNLWVKVTTQILILDISNEHQDILDYIDDNTLIKEFCQRNNCRRHFISR